MQKSWVWSLVWEDPTCLGTTKPVRTAIVPGSRNFWARVQQSLKPIHPRACALQQEKLLQWESRALQQRVAPTHCNQRKPVCSSEGPVQPKINKKIFFKMYQLTRRKINEHKRLRNNNAGLTKHWNVTSFRRKHCDSWCLQFYSNCIYSPTFSNIQASLAHTNKRARYAKLAAN